MFAIDKQMAFGFALAASKVVAFKLDKDDRRQSTVVVLIVSLRCLLCGFGRSLELDVGLQDGPGTMRIV
jgi:hypothetical protein